MFVTNRSHPCAGSGSHACVTAAAHRRIAFPTVAAKIQMRIRRKNQGAASLTDWLKSTVAAPAGTVGCVVQEAIFRNFHDNAVVARIPESPMAFPAIARGVQIGIGGNFDGVARVSNFAKSAFAFPSAPVRQARQVGVRRHQYRLTRPLQFGKTAIALPSSAMGFRTGVFGNWICSSLTMCCPVE